MITLRKHLIALESERQKFEKERDRRYAEVNIEKEKALKIKETADLAALQLARDIQIYKDEKANELREQISSERGNYAAKEDIATLRDYLDALNKPVIEFMAAYQGRYTEGRDSKLNLSYVFGGIVCLIVVLTLILSVTHVI